MNQLHVYTYPLPLSLPPTPPILPILAITEHRAELPELCSRTPLATYLTHGKACMSIQSPNSSHPPSPMVTCPSPVLSSVSSDNTESPTNSFRNQGLFFFFVLINLFLLYWVFIAMHGLSLVRVSGGYSLVAVHSLLILVASLVKHVLWTHGL